jgi:hypothetical protein
MQRTYSSWLLKDDGRNNLSFLLPLSYRYLPSALSRFSSLFLLCPIVICPPPFFFLSFTLKNGSSISVLPALSYVYILPSSLLHSFHIHFIYPLYRHFSPPPSHLSSITPFFLSFIPFLPLYSSMFLPFPLLFSHSSSFTSKHFLCPRSSVCLSLSYLVPSFVSPVFFSLLLFVRPISSPRILATADDG